MSDTQTRSFFSTPPWTVSSTSILVVSPFPLAAWSDKKAFQGILTPFTASTRKWAGISCSCQLHVHLSLETVQKGKGGETYTHVDSLERNPAVRVSITSSSQRWSEHRSIGEK